MIENQIIVDFALRRYNQMWTDAAGARERIKGVLKYISPDDEDVQKQATTTQQDIDGDLYDAAPIEANDTLAAGSLAYLCPANEIWFGCGAPMGMEEDDEAQKTYAKCGEIMRKYLAASNFYGRVHMVIRDRAVGIGAMFCSMRNGRLWFKRFMPGEYAFVENEFGEVEEFTEKVYLSNRQAVEKFGEDNVSEKCLKSVKDDGSTTADEKHWYVHLIFKRPDGWRGRDSKGEFTEEGASKPVADVYVDEDAKFLCQNGGFEEMPIFITRWEDASGDSYGRGPGQKALPTIKSLNYNCAMQDAAEELSVFPPMQGPTNLKEPDMISRACNRYDENRPDARWEPLYVPTQIQVGLQQIQDKRAQVKSMFFTDSFTVFTDSTKRMATFEAMQLADEKLAMFHPAMVDFYIDFIVPMFTRRLFPMMIRARLFPSFPASVAQWMQTHGSDSIAPNMVFLSKLSQAVKNVQLKGTYAMLQILPAIQPFDQGASLRIKWDTVVTDAARTLGMPESQIRSDKEVQELKQAMQQQQELQQQLEMTAKGAAAAKDAASAGLIGTRQ